MQILNVTGLKKVYTTRFGGSQVTALRQVDFSVEEGEYVAIMGESGSGKTTLLNILAALDKPTAGRVELDGRDMSAVRESDAAAFRRDNLGFVFQDFNLLDTFTLRDNIYLPLVLAGRPYHIDAEIGHGIDQLATSLGFVVVSEDSVYHLAQTPNVRVLNQWTYHARLYSAAKYVAESGDTGLNLVQLVSFGCGVDAVTTDEVRAILERAGRIYTQVKIDEIANLGAVRIRLRSLFAAVGKEAARHGKPN